MRLIVKVSGLGGLVLSAQAKHSPTLKSQLQISLNSSEFGGSDRHKFQRKTVHALLSEAPTRTETDTERNSAAESGDTSGKSVKEVRVFRRPETRVCREEPPTMGHKIFGREGF